MAQRKSKKTERKHIVNKDLEPVEHSAKPAALAWTLGLLLLFQPMILDLFCTDEYETPKLVFLRFAVSALIAAWAWDAMRTGSVSLKTRILWPFAALLLAVILSTSTSSSVWVSVFGEYGSYAGLQSTLLYLIVALAAFSLPNRQSLRLVLLFELLGVGLSTGMGLVEASGHEIGTFFGLTANIPDNSTSGFFGNPNYFAGFTVANMALAVYLIRDRFKPFAIFALLVALSSGVALVLSGSRTGIMFVILDAIVLFVLFWFHRRGAKIGKDQDVKVRSNWNAKSVSLLVVPVLFVFIIGAWVAGPQLQRVGRSALSPFHSIARDRLDLWQSALGLAAEHPFLGSGPDTFAAAAAAHYPLSVYKRLGANVTARRAHDEVLNTLACTGLIGLLAWLWFFAGSMWRGFTFSWRRRGREESLLALSLTIGLSFGVGFNLLHFFTVGQAPWLYALVGMILALPRLYNDDSLVAEGESKPSLPVHSELKKWSPKMAWPIFAFAVVLLVASSVDGKNWIDAEHALKKSYVANLRKHPAQALEGLRRAVKLKPDQRRYHEALAQSLLRYAKSDADLKQARASIQRALELGRSPLSLWVALAIERRAGQVDAAEVIAKEVVAADPTRPRELESISQWLLGLGRYETVSELLDIVFAKVPERVVPLALQLATLYQNKRYENIDPALRQRFTVLARHLAEQVVDKAHSDKHLKQAKTILARLDSD